MKKDLWRRAEEIFHAALERPPEARRAFLDEACGGDTELRRQVEMLISKDEHAGSFLEKPALADVTARPGARGALVGNQYGPYRILSLLGAGGMGEVYRAHDGKLGRDVAIKTLPSEFARDPDRAARFQREAKLLASLNHPNIAAIHGMEESEGTNFLVLELVEGETLADQLKHGLIPVEESLKLALQIAEALEAAHEKGIIHRDLKPANIKITPDGKVKVLDFGLAKAFAGEQAELNLSNSPALSDAATQEGVILGTAAYMSPEQAKGKTVDKRADIWAFGVVLFEVLTGRQLFTGETVSETLAAVLMREPDFSILPPNLHLRIRLLLERCLEREAQNRYHDISDARVDIQKALANAKGATLQHGAELVPQSKIRRLFPWAAALVSGLLLTGLALWNFRPAGAPQFVSRTLISLSPGVALATNAFSMLALSPDGMHLAYVATGAGSTQQLYLRAIDSFESRAVPGTEGASTPFFSPNGQWIGFSANSQIKKVSVSGGAALKLCDAPNIRGAAWGTNDTIVFSAGLSTGLSQVSAAGGAPRELTKLNEGETSHRWPQFLPDGKTILFAIGTGAASDDSSIAVQRMDTGERKILFRGGTYGRYFPTGHLVYYRAGTMMAVSFDVARLELSGTPAPVLNGVMSSVGDNGAAQFSFSDRGALVYIPGGSQNLNPPTLVWVDRKGVAQPLPARPRPYQNPRLSPNGRKVALSITEGAKSDIYIYDLARDTMTRLSFEGINNFPLWTPDGKRVAYRSQRGGGSVNLCWKPADGSGSEETLTTSENLKTALSFSPDGKILVYTELNPKTNYDIWALPLEGERKPRLVLQTSFNERTACFSPDGRWLAYISEESGRYEVYVQPFPGPGGKYQISTEGGSEIFWGRNGELSYRTGANREKMMVVETRTQPGFSAGKSRLLFEGPYVSNAVNSAWALNYSVSADGQRFLMLKEKEQPQAAALTQINIVHNWLEELKQRVPVK